MHYFYITALSNKHAIPLFLLKGVTLITDQGPYRFAEVLVYHSCVDVAITIQFASQNVGIFLLSRQSTPKIRPKLFTLG